MLLGAIGASAVSQLYQGLTGPKTAAASYRAQEPGSPPPDDQARQPGSGSTVSSASAKVLADLKALLLGVQAGGTGPSAATATSAGPGATGSSPDPASDLATLLGDLKKPGSPHGHHHPQGPPPGATQTDGLTGTTALSPDGSGQKLVAALTKGINAYAASLKAGSAGTASVSA